MALRVLWAQVSVSLSVSLHQMRAVQYAQSKRVTSTGISKADCV